MENPSIQPQVFQKHKTSLTTQKSFFFSATIFSAVMSTPTPTQPQTTTPNIEFSFVINFSVRTNKKEIHILIE